MEKNGIYCLSDADTKGSLLFGRLPFGMGYDLFGRRTKSVQPCGQSFHPGIHLSKLCFKSYILLLHSLVSSLVLCKVFGQCLVFFFDSSYKSSFFGNE